ncbi:MAG: adenylate/guanylate cyclase domain-containing protein [Spirochaetales bacterium]|nr:adenylate/guanylate cyclase domain-containing protein [Spirochaetales bacterium]
MQTTRLEAIMFTDIAGYSRLMDEDEERTIDLLKRHNEIVLPIIESASGVVIDAIGDGLLVVFPSVRRAVACAVAIQDAIDFHNSTAEASDQFKLRVGIHLGEVWHEDDRVYGTGVNVAARVQPFALPGGVCITEDVHRQVERKIESSIVSIGVQTLKNIARPYELFRVVTGHEVEPVGAVSGAHVASEPMGELDKVKEELLSELQKIGEKRKQADGSGHGGGSLEHRIESKVYGLVEHVMDRALDKWDKMPEEKKLGLIRSGKLSVDLGKRSDDDDDDDESSSGSAGTMAFGAAASIGFGLGYFYFGLGWMIWPFALAGILPFVVGLYELIKRSVRTRAERAGRPAQLEREVLQVARRLGGRVTVVQVAAETGHSLDEIQLTLDTMTSKGYVSQEILETGVIRYDFPSFLGDETE